MRAERCALQAAACYRSGGGLPNPAFLGTGWVWRLPVILALGCSAQLALAQSAGKPRVPPGRDPGGAAVAIVGDGIDYTWPAIAARLARDGEGEIVGWDFIDNDRRPFERCQGDRRSNATCASARALRIVRDAPAARLVVVRASADRPQSLVQAFAFIAAGSARIVLLAPASASGSTDVPERFLVEAAQRYPTLLIIVAASDSRPEVVRTPTTLVVTAADSPPMAGALSADLAVPVTGAPAHKNEIAAATVAALVARLLASEPSLDAATIKARLLSLKAPAGGTQPLPGHKIWIERPQPHFEGRP